MLTSIKIENLRGIAEGELSGLTEMNVIVGPNNSGKSTILDGILLGASPAEGPALNTLMGRRSVQQPARWLIRKIGRDSEKSATVAVMTNGTGEQRDVGIIVNPQGNAAAGAVRPDAPRTGPAFLTPGPAFVLGERKFYPYQPLRNIPEVRLIDPLADAKTSKLYDLYTKVVESGLRKEAKELVKAVIPDLEDIEILTTQNQPVLYLVFPGYAHPVELAGDGIVLLLKLVFELATCAGGIALLEEPETHLHPAAIKQCVRALWAAARRGIQIVLTTHSLDLIDSLLSVEKDSDLTKVSVFRVQLEQGILKSYRISGSDALLARTQIEDDLR